MRVIAIVLVGLAGLLYFGVTLPARREADAAFQAYSHAREERRRVQVRLTQLERRASTLRPAAALPRSAGPADLVALRRALLKKLQAVPAQKLRLELRPAAAPLAAGVTITLVGPFREAVRLSGALVTPGDGLIPELLRFTPEGSGVTLDLQGAALAQRQ